MPRLVVPALLIALGACSGEGITVEIFPGDTAAQRVELFVVDAPCEDCASGFTPPARMLGEAATRLPGITYLRNNPAPFAADLVDGVATFELRPQGADHTVDLMVAVGYGPTGDAGDAVVGVQVLARSTDTADGYVRLRATLATPLDTVVANAPPTDPGTRVQVWRQADGDQAGCLALERWQHDGNGRIELAGDRQFIVPIDDRDCDNHLPPDECDAYYPNAPDSQDTRVCVTLDETSPDGKACVLGAEAACTNDSGNGGCAAYTGTCFPSRLCKPTGDQGCADSTELDCTKQHIFDAPFIALECKVPTYTSTTSVKSVCSSSAVIPLPPSSGGLTCQGGILTAANGIYGMETTQATFGTVAVSLTRGASDCIFRLGVDGLLPDVTQAKLPTFVLKLTLENGARLVVPTQVTLLAPSLDCATAEAIHCEPVTDASLESCAQR